MIPIRSIMRKKNKIDLMLFTSFISILSNKRSRVQYPAQKPKKTQNKTSSRWVGITVSKRARRCVWSPKINHSLHYEYSLLRNLSTSTKNYFLLNCCFYCLYLIYLYIWTHAYDNFSTHVTSMHEKKLCHKIDGDSDLKLKEKKIMFSVLMTTFEYRVSCQNFSCYV